MTITIRRAKPSDAKIIAEFNFAMAKETEHFELDRKRLLRGVASLLKDASNGFYILAEVDRKIVGQLMITYEWSDWRCGTFWWIQSVYVAPDYRSKGVFTKLFRHIEKEMKKNRSVCGLRLYVEQGNIRAQQTYEHIGMKKTGYELYEIDVVLGGSRIIPTS